MSEAPFAPAPIAWMDDMDARFHQGALPWTGRIAAVYAERDALRISLVSGQAHPQVETESGLFLGTLEK